MGRPSNTAQRREQIIDGLLKVMASNGYAKASVQAVAKAARLSPGLVHYHFASKLEILVALVERLDASFEARLAARIDRAGDDPKRQLDAWIDAALARGEGSSPEAVQAWVFIGAEALRQAEVKRVYEDAIRRRIEYLEGLLRAALRDDGSSTRNAKRLAAMLVAAVDGAYQLGTAAADAVPQGFAAPTLRRLVAAAMAAERGR